MRSPLVSAPHSTERVQRYYFFFNYANFLGFLCKDLLIFQKYTIENATFAPNLTKTTNHST